VTILKTGSAQLDTDAFMNRVTAASPDGNTGRRILLYVHGFNNAFEDALYQAAQLAYDLQFTGAVIAFSWPSYDGNFNTYLPAKLNSEAAGPHLRSVLLALGKSEHVKDLTVVAHSMGGAMTWRELARIANDLAAVKKLANVILAAPDIAEEQFRLATQEIVKAGIPSTIYASRLDKALEYSRDANNALFNTRGQGRAGLLIAIDGLDVVDASGHELDIARHSYFATKTVLEDLRPLVLYGKRAKDRTATLTPKSDEKTGVSYWVLAKK
jgi:esterase/lipase superfamily enzyme